MVLFGAPKRAEESLQALRAVRTAFGMKARAEELTRAIRERGIPADLKVRVGINTGHCTVGVLGSDVMRAYKAVGFAVNVAARLQSEAEPGPSPGSNLRVGEGSGGSRAAEPPDAQGCRPPRGGVGDPSAAGGVGRRGPPPH